MLRRWVLYKHCPSLTEVISVPGKHKRGRATSASRLGPVRAARWQVTPAQGQEQASGWRGGGKNQNVSADFPGKLEKVAGYPLSGRTSPGVCSYGIFEMESGI